MNTKFKSNWWKFLPSALLMCACNTAVVNAPIETSATAAPPQSPAPVAPAEKSHSPTTYEVGPSANLKTPNDVPWNKLQAGDTVLIHWRSEPYKNKWVIAVEGTEKAPITIRGMAGPNGALPVIDGEDATTSKYCDYWGEARGVVKIGGARNANKIGSKWIVIENLDFTSGRPAFSFTDGKGKVEKYVRNAAALWVEHCEHLIIRNCTLRNSGNGLVVSSNDKYAGEDIMVESCHVFDNGDPSGYEHNAYTEAKGITFQYNWFGPLRKGAVSNNLKDRSSACVIRYNWFDGGDKVLDLVDAEDSKIIREDPRYRQTFVYGNVLIKRGGPIHPQVVHYGGDGPKASTYRKGTLYFYNNTVVSTKKDGTQLFWISSNDEICDARNNIFFTEGSGKSMVLTRSGKGILQLNNNFLKPGFRHVSEAKDAIIRGEKTSVVDSTPGFVDGPGENFHLSSHSVCQGNAAPLAPAALSIDRQYKKHQSSTPISPGQKLSIGAFQP
ncbi:MAG: right-handed parallel beta-helix repeat-containing protein [Limisphaerales bacterium]